MAFKLFLRPIIALAVGCSQLEMLRLLPLSCIFYEMLVVAVNCFAFQFSHAKHLTGGNGNV